MSQLRKPRVAYALEDPQGRQTVKNGRNFKAPGPGAVPKASRGHMGQAPGIDVGLERVQELADRAPGEGARTSPADEHIGDHPGLPCLDELRQGGQVDLLGPEGDRAITMR